ncbi:TM2 domain-containing protein [uncultured Bacteroides sp.]|uniref:TM2 domain-containing protein n=1 Tax=uncultured Bacteroides sp. TaxID=162156 RepID=UPI002AAAE179|nr:TM2 domain-containing protein [uncultured Bacteroides sp.]
MDTQKVDMFIMGNGKYLPEEKLHYIRERLESLDENKWNYISTMQFKNPTVSLIISIFLGCYGIDRFYLGHIGLGIGKLITCGGFGIWAIIDWFMIMDATKEANFEKFCMLL